MPHNPANGMHKDITSERICNAVEDDDYLGFCVYCGSEHSGCEPDARNYVCDECGEAAVFGAEELLIYL